MSRFLITRVLEYIFYWPKCSLSLCHSACLPQGKSNISDAVAMHPDVDTHECAFITDNAVMVHARDLEQGEVSVETGLIQSVILE